MGSKIKLNKKTYVANLRFETGEPELKALSSNVGDVYSMRSPEGRLRAESKKFHGKRSAGERSKGKPWF